MSVFTGKSALITGASAGLGGDFARQLAALGVARMVVTARRLDRLKELKDELIAAYPALQVDTIPADLSDPAAVTQFISDLEKEKRNFDIVINNAGLGDLGMFESSDPAKIVAMLEVNVVALTRLTRWALPAMLKAKSGWICNVGSTAGILPLPSFASYAATKAYVNSFSEALRVELRGSGVYVTALLPGPVETEFGQVASRKNSKRQFGSPAFLLIESPEVVRQMLAGMQRGQARVIPGLTVRFPMLVAESTPRWFLRFVFNFTSGGFRKERAESKQP